MSSWAIYCWAIFVGRKQKSPVQHSKAIVVCAQQNSPNKTLFIYICIVYIIYIYVYIYIYIYIYLLFLVPAKSTLGNL